MEKRVLGRGLEALISSQQPQQETAHQQQTRERVQTLRVEQIQASRFQPRLSFSQEKIQELAKSIHEQGIIQPVIVRAVVEGGDKYELIAGERRFRAIQHLGLGEIPAIIRKVADADVLEMSIIENVQREDLNPLDEAKAYRRLSQEFGHTQEHIANRVGKDKTSISNLLRLLNLPENIQDFLSANKITFGHAKALLSIHDEKRQLQVCEKIMQNELSVRQAEQLATGGFKHRVKAAKKFERNTDLRSIEEKLQHALGTKVRIYHGKKRGKIEIEYYSLDDLDRVLKILRVK